LLASAGNGWSGQPSPILSPSNNESGGTVLIHKNQREVDVPQGAGTAPPSAQ
jgi:hypothetical protein